MRKFACVVTLCSMTTVASADGTLYAPVDRYDWSGCYIGAQAGYGWGRSDAVSTGAVNGVADGTNGLTKVSDRDVNGPLGGGTVGCNYQIGSLVIGVEGDGSWANKTGGSILATGFDPRFTEDVLEHSLFTVRGRLGVAWDRALFYATAGGAWARVSIHEFNTVAGVFATCGGVAQPAGACSATEDQTLAGWTVGIGGQYALTRNLSAKLEYLHVDFGHEAFLSTTATACCTSERRGMDQDIVRVGLYWRFSSDPLNILGFEP